MEDKIKEIIIKHTGGEISTYGFKRIEIRRGELDKIAQDIVKLFAIPDVSKRYSYSEIEEILNSQIDFMIKCVQDSEGSIDPSEDVNDIETTLKVLKHIYNVC